MPSSPRARIFLASTAAASVLLLAACGTPETSGGNAETTPSVTSTPLPESGNESPVPTDAPTPVSPEDVTCENLLSADALAILTEEGRTFREEPFTVGELTLEGITCSWADYSAATSDILIFGWAAATADEIAEVQASLEATGWLREEEAGSLYITEDPSQAMSTDANNYGMTYQFGEDWITVSDTKQNLLLIDVPGI